MVGWKMDPVVTWQGSRWGRTQVRIARPGWTAVWLRPEASGLRYGELPGSGPPAKQKWERSNSTLQCCCVVTTLRDPDSQWERYIQGSTELCTDGSFYWLTNELVPFLLSAELWNWLSRRRAKIREHPHISRVHSSGFLFSIDSIGIVLPVQLWTHSMEA
jgi:hypothetical protein